jgi:PKD repeat protein
MWFKTTTTDGGKLIGFGDKQTGLSGNYDRHVIMLNTGQLQFGVWTGSANTILSANSYNDGNWHYMVATQGSDGMTLYVDGVAVGTNPQTQAQPYTGYWRVGGDVTWGGTNSNYFAGSLDEVAVYSSELTAAQVQVHYAAGGGAVVHTAPTAAFTAPSCTVGVPCTFTSSSTPGDSAISGYDWNFGDGTGHGAGASVTHTFAASGPESVTLTVTDANALTGSVTNPVTVAAVVTLYAQDSFTRMISGGWGAADLGGNWSPLGSAFNVSGSYGAIAMPKVSSGSSIFLNGVSKSDTDVQVSVTTDKAATGGGIYVYVIGRRITGQGDYRAKVQLVSSGAVKVFLTRTSSAGVETDLTSATVAGLTYVPGTSLRVRLQVTGTGPTSLRAKVWVAGTTEPAAWAVSATDATAGLQAAGSVGVGDYLSGSATNAPVVVRFDDFQAGPTH